ncbi:hypothetical protein [Victivallis sp. Marseille-Q1083]|uniref:hypothetical protein n=1 Tax=Victivallis sp. Marseille-Q1083 TaxID=2717288 RepID=UPI00158EB81B|nr:hypothetical protein [Victivallis sp. Marseille-Q1083]
MSLIINILLAIVMIGGLIGMLVCQKKQRTNPQLKSVALLLFAAVVICGGFFLHNTGMLRQWGLDFGFNERVLNADAAIYGSQAAILADTLRSNNLLSEKILIIYSDGFEASAEFAEFKNQLLAAGVAEANLICVPAFETPAGGQPPRLTAQMLEKAAAGNKDCKVIISAAGAPSFDAAQLSCFKRRSDRAQQWIFLEPLPVSNLLQHGLQNGNVLAACGFNRNPAGEIGSLPEDQKEIFELRYMLYSRDGQTGR